MEKKISRANLLGIGISTINLQQAVNCVDLWIANKFHNYVCVTPVHAIVDYRKDPELVKIVNNSGLTTPDGMPVVWVMKLMGHKNVSRVYGPDLMLALCEHSQKMGYRNYFYGSAPGVPEKLSKNLIKKFPDLIVVGIFSPPYRELTVDEDKEIVEQINSTNPDIVWIGISSPKQERWMANHQKKITAPVMIGVGAAFDFLSGVKKQAPLWMQKNGLEWLFRLYSEPKRLWKRYFLSNSIFIILIMLQLLGFKRFKIDLD